MNDGDAERIVKRNVGPRLSRRGFLGGAGAAAVGGPVSPNMPTPAGMSPDVFLTMMKKFLELNVKPGKLFETFGDIKAGGEGGVFEQVFGSGELLRDGRVPEHARWISGILRDITDKTADTKIGEIVKKDFLDVVYPASGKEAPSQKSIDAFLKTIRSLGLDENATLGDIKKKLAPCMAEYVEKMLKKLPDVPVNDGYPVYGKREQTLQDLNDMVPDGEAYDGLEDAVKSSQEDMYGKAHEMRMEREKRQNAEIEEMRSERDKKRNEERQQEEAEYEQQRQKESPYILCTVEKSALRKELFSDGARVPAMTYILRSENTPPNKANVLKLSQQLSPHDSPLPGLIETEPLMRTNRPDVDSLDLLVTVEKDSPLQKHFEELSVDGENVWLPRTETQKTE